MATRNSDSALPHLAAPRQTTMGAPRAPQKPAGGIDLLKDRQSIGTEAVAQISELLQAAQKELNDIDAFGNVTVLRLLLNRAFSLNDAVSGVLDDGHEDSTEDLMRSVYGTDMHPASGRRTSHV